MANETASELVLDSLKVLSNDSISLLESNTTKTGNTILSVLTQRLILKFHLSSVEISEQELIDLKNNFLLFNKLDDEKYTDYLNKKSLSEHDFLQSISLPLREKKFLKQKFSNKSHAHFLKRKNDLDQILYSLIRTKEHFEAKELFLRVQDDESSFGQISKEYSQGPEKNSFGLVGPVPINRAHPIMREILRSAIIGETNEPFKIGEWWLIVRVNERHEAELNQEMELKMETELSKIWLKEEAQLIINNLKKIQNF